MSDTAKTIEVIKPCPHPEHAEFDGASYGDDWDDAAYCNPPYSFGSRRKHPGAEVITLTEEQALSYEDDFTTETTLSRWTSGRVGEKP